MKKVGIISFYHNSHNYGGILQAFALTHVLNSNYNVMAEQIDYKSIKKKYQHNKFALNYIKSQGVISFVQKYFKRLQKKYYMKHALQTEKDGINLRNSILDKFRIERIPHSVLYTIESLQSTDLKYDILIAGSDQIWKPSVIDDIYALNFGLPNVRRSSYAASLSIESMNGNDLIKYKKWLSSFFSVSVRESNAVDILKPIFPDVQWTCDPTALLTADEWRLLLPKEIKIKEKYVFCYFLGDTNKYRKIAEIFAKTRNLKLVTLPNLLGYVRKEDADFGDYKLYDVDPFDFIKLIDEAEYVFTDSFHAVSFSLYMHTKFVVFSREAINSMNSRLNSLLTYVELQDCMYKSDVSFVSDDYFSWNLVDNKLESLRNDSKKFIDHVLS